MTTTFPPSSDTTAICPSCGQPISSCNSTKPNQLSSSDSTLNETSSDSVASTQEPQLNEKQQAKQQIPPPPPPPQSLSHLITLLHHELSTTGLDTLNVSKIQSLMSSYTSNHLDWEQFAHFDFTKRYTRNLVDDGNGKFNLMILCWSHGQESPIHDHSNAHCIMKVLDGELVETRYAWPEDSNSNTMNAGEMRITNEAKCGRDETVYIHDKIGLHRVSNPSDTKPAVSLHLYTPPFETCKTFDKNTGVARASGKCTFYSVLGEKVVYNFTSVGNGTNGNGNCGEKEGSYNITDSGYEDTQ